MTIVLVGLLNFAELPNKQKNGFLRNISQNALSKIHETHLNVNVNTIFGVTDSLIFLKGNTYRAALVYNYNSHQFDTISYLIPENISKVSPPYTMHLLYPNLYIHLNNTGGILSGNIDDPKFTDLKIDLPIFTKSTMISDHEILIRCFKNNTPEIEFQVIDINSKRTISSSTLLSMKDSLGFSTDGILKYEQTSGLGYYLQHFNNSLTCFDSVLNIVYQSKTIDTVTYKEIDLVTEVGGAGNKLSNANARVLVNNEMVVGEGLIFVESALFADNETEKDQISNTPIDVYKTETGEYLGSFHIPAESGSKMKSFYYHKNKLFVLYEKLITIYQLNRPALFALN